MTCRISPATKKFRILFASWRCGCLSRRWKRKADEAIRSHLRAVVSGKNDRRGWTVRQSDAAESRRFRLHAGGRLQDYPGESADCGGARGEGVGLAAGNAARSAGEDRSGGCVPEAGVRG